MGCIVDSQQRQRRVKVVGTYEHNTMKWLVEMVDEWPRPDVPLPMDKDRVRFVGCFGMTKGAGFERDASRTPR